MLRYNAVGAWLACGCIIRSERFTQKSNKSNSISERQQGTRRGAFDQAMKEWCSCVEKYEITWM